MHRVRRCQERDHDTIPAGAFAADSPEGPEASLYRDRRHGNTELYFTE